MSAHRRSPTLARNANEEKERDEKEEAMSTQTNFLQAAQDQASIVACKRRVSELINKGSIGVEVLHELVPNGQPHLFEKSLWDYKAEIAVLPPSPSQSQIESHSIKMAEIVKDVVAFYNSFGGYIVAGVNDNPRRLTGFEGKFDCGDLAKKVKGATQHSIDCHFAVVQVNAPTGTIRVGVLHIPKRPDGIEPAQFLKEAPAKPSGKPANTRNDINLREGDESRPATKSEDYSFLCSPGRRTIASRATIAEPVLNNNLGPRDPSFIQFVGRESYLEQLWKWICDRYSSTKLLAGLGGLGKTTIAREFAEEVTRTSPMGLEGVLWFSAKQQFYTAILDKYQPTSRVDFMDVTTLLRSALRELGHPDSEIEPDATREALIEMTVESLALFPSMVIIDDVDSLDAQSQNDVFQSIVQVMNRTMGTNRPFSRVLFTARLNLGAAPGQLIHLAGLSIEEFTQFVAITSNSLGVPFDSTKRQMEAFHRTSGGSPTFAASIIRLLQTGESLQAALAHWKGAAGEDVRRFAFKKEIDNLTDSQIRTLYALCVLGQTSQVEVQHILQSNDARLRDDLGALRLYHLLSLGGEAPAGGARLEIPGTIQMMRDIIRERVTDPVRIEQDCLGLRRGAAKMAFDLGPSINRIVALWRQDKHSEALEVAKFAADRSPKNPDAQCLVGRGYMKIIPADPEKADIALRKAHKLGCERPELFGLWAQAKQLLQDWVGVVDVTRLADKISPSSENLMMRAQAFEALGESAEQSGNLSKAAEYFREGGRDIDEAFKSGGQWNRYLELKELRSTLLFNYVRIVDRANPSPRDNIQVWLAFLEAFECFLRRPLVVRTGIRRLAAWWEAVCQRETPDEKATELMKLQLEKLDFVLQTLREQKAPEQDVLAEVERTKAILLSSWNDYRRRALEKPKSEQGA